MYKYFKINLYKLLNNIISNKPIVLLHYNIPIKLITNLIDYFLHLELILHYY